MWLILFSTWILNINALSTPTKISKKVLLAELQKSYKPQQIIDNVGKNLINLTPDFDPEGSVASLVLVRLSKQLITLDNNRDLHKDSFDVDFLEKIVESFARADWNLSSQAREGAVEGTKAAAVLSKLLSLQSSKVWDTLVEKWNTIDADSFEPHQISGLKWAFDVLTEDCYLPLRFQKAYDALKSPFRIRSNLCGKISDLTVSNLLDQVNFRTEEIRTQSNKIVKERRQTAWQGDSHVDPLCILW